MFLLILLIIGAADNFLGVPFFRQSISTPISSNTMFFEGQDIHLAEKSGAEREISRISWEILAPGILDFQNFLPQGPCDWRLGRDRGARIPYENRGARIYENRDARAP